MLQSPLFRHHNCDNAHLPAIVTSLLMPKRVQDAMAFTQVPGVTLKYDQ